jgi:hypothetical protein
MTATSSTFQAALAGADSSGAAARFVKSMANDCAAFALTITGGLHTGASVRGRRCMTLGASPEDDLMLRDVGVQAAHAEIARLNGVWAVLSSIDGAARALAPVETLRRGRFLRQRFQIGGASFVLTQAMPLPVLSVRVRQVSWWRSMWIWPVALVTLILTVAAFSMLPSNQKAPEAPDAQAMAARGWPDVQVVAEPSGGFRVTGYVEDAAQLERLHQWLESESLGILTWQVRSGVESVVLVRQALGAEGVTVEYAGAGRVRVQGTVSDMAIRQRLRGVAADLAGIVQIEDRLAVVDTQASAPRMRPLPFRILDVVPGENGYFRTDSGARYFIGATLSDGAEVVSISADAIEFRQGDRQVFYPLK